MCPVAALTSNQASDPSNRCEKSHKRPRCPRRKRTITPTPTSRQMKPRPAKLSDFSSAKCLHENTEQAYQQILRSRLTALVLRSQENARIKVENVRLRQQIDRLRIILAIIRIEEDPK